MTAKSGNTVAVLYYKIEKNLYKLKIERAKSSYYRNKIQESNRNPIKYGVS